MFGQNNVNQCGSMSWGPPPLPFSGWIVVHCEANIFCQCSFIHLGQTCPQGQAHSIQNGGQSMKTLDMLQNTLQMIMVLSFTLSLGSNMAAGWIPYVISQKV